MAMLEVRDIHTYYGNIQALKGVTLEVEEGEQSGHEFWAQLHGLIAEHLPEREQARLIQCDAAFRAIAEEPGAAPAIEVYPTPELAAFDRRSARARPR